MKDKIKELREEANKLEKIRKEFPDLREGRDRWNKKFLCAKSVNVRVNKYTATHSCGCCSDSPYYIMPYLEFEGERIYSDPFQICVGERCEYIYGQRWYSDWKDRLSKHEIPESLIAEIKKEADDDMKCLAAYERYENELDEI